MNTCSLEVLIPSDVERQFKVENNTEFCINVEMMLHDCYGRDLSYQNIRKKVKYNQSRIGDQAMFNSWKNNLKKHLQCTLQTSHINEIDKNKLELYEITYEYSLFMNLKLMHDTNYIV